MPSYEIEFPLAGLSPDDVEAALQDIGAGAITFLDGGDEPVLEPRPGEVRLWSDTRVRALFDDNCDAAQSLSRLAARLGPAITATAQVRGVAERVWERVWLADWKSMRFGDRLWVCPTEAQAPAAHSDLAGTTHLTRAANAVDPSDPAAPAAPADHTDRTNSVAPADHTDRTNSVAPADHTDSAGCVHPGDPADPAAVIVRLDPGLAFGTGSHPTTALCLEALASLDLTGRTVIDYGCGSGILAIAALKLGASAAIAVDLDPQALLATQSNARINGVDARLTTQDVAAPLPPADCVVANILAGILIDLSPRLTAACKPHADLVLSGILNEQVAAVTTAYQPGFEFAHFAERDGWSCVRARRRMGTGRRESG
jgi:ribosomal protein L11 methylase PrmA